MHLKSYRAFTLVELMIVIAIIGILVLAAMSLVNSQNTKQQRAIRFAELVEDTITRAKQDMVIGRGSWSGTTDKKMIPNTQQTVIISSGSIISKYKPQGADAEKDGKKLESPFLEGNRGYKIAKIETSSGRITTDDKLSGGHNWQENKKLTLNFGINGDMLITGNKVEEDLRSFMITVEYEVFKRYIVGDKVSGIITTYRKPIKPQKP